MKLPPSGLCLPCRLVKVRDGDTPVVRIRPGGFEWAIRLIDCWCAESNTPEGKAATAYLRRLLCDNKQLHVWIPAPTKAVGNLLKCLTFDRVPGYLFVSYTDTVNELMVAAGHATFTKPQKRKTKCVA